MANGTDTDDEEVQDQEVGQDFRQPPQVVAPAVPTAAPVIVAPPGGRTVAPPVFNYPGFDAQAIALDTQRRSMINQGVPLDQAEKAVASAQRFQAQRGYQRDLQNGMSASEAFMKWAPTMFGSSGGAASALSRVVTQPPLTVGGVAYTRLPGGRLQEMLGQRVRSSQAAPPGLLADIADARRTLNTYVKDIEKAEASLDETAKAGLPTLRQRRRDLESYIQMREQQLQTPTSAPVSPPTPAVSAPAIAVGGRVRVRRKDGKIGSIPANQLQAALDAGYSRVP